MIEISLHNSGFVAFIDDEDYEAVTRHKWYLYDYKDRTLYAQNNKGLKLQNVIIPEVPEGCVRHHKNGNGLDNQRKNLKVITNLENLQNKSIYKNNKSGCPGVKWCEASKSWQVQLTVNKKRRYLGIFFSLDDAIAARKAGEQKYKGEEI